MLRWRRFRSLPHQGWWKEFLRYTEGTDFGHRKTYFTLRDEGRVRQPSRPHGPAEFCVSRSVAEPDLLGLGGGSGLGEQSSGAAAMDEKELYE